MAAPTIYDIAAHAGVGIATVSRVLNGSSRVSSKTRQAVQQAMKELGFRPNAAARRLAAGNTGRPRVAALMPFFTTAFYFSVCKALSETLSSSNADLLLLDVKNQQDAKRHIDRLIAERSCDGVILCSMGLGDEQLTSLANLNVPVVALDHQSDRIPHICVDNVAGGRLLATALSDQGSKNPALIVGTREARVFQEREAGFREAAPAHALVFETEQVNYESGAALVATILERMPEVDGIACVGDPLAVGVIQELRAKGRLVPDEIQVVGFDDQPLMDALQLTTIAQPMEEFGRWAAETVLGQLKEPGGPRPANKVVPLQLVWRGTTRPRSAPAPSEPSAPQ